MAQNTFPYRAVKGRQKPGGAIEESVFLVIYLAFDGPAKRLLHQGTLKGYPP
jgi:hypothetical protein